MQVKLNSYSYNTCYMYVYLSRHKEILTLNVKFEKHYLNWYLIKITSK